MMMKTSELRKKIVPGTLLFVNENRAGPTPFYCLVLITSLTLSQYDAIEHSFYVLSESQMKLVGNHYSEGPYLFGHQVCDGDEKMKCCFPPSSGGE